MSEIDTICTLSGERVALPPLPMTHPVTDYVKLNRISQGTYGIVYRARKGDKLYALKRILLSNESSFPIHALREIMLLSKLRHPNIVNVLNVAVSLGSLL